MLFAREIVVSLLLAAASPVVAEAAVWPIPQSISTGTTHLLIDEAMAVSYNGMPIVDFLGGLVEPENVSNDQHMVQAGVARAMASIFKTGLYPWKLRPKNSAAEYEPAIPGSSCKSVSKLAITQTKSRNSKAAAKVDTLDESYNLTLTTAGEATLRAHTYVGVLRGLETFSQLFYEHSNGAAHYTPYAPVKVVDTPKYAHRGVLMDVARNWFDVSHIYRTMDAMAWNKMNRLHLHATDSQSWPLDLPSMPEVAREGAYRSDLVYSAADLEAMQKYAVARGIELIVEIDMPGHIGSLALSHPELIVAYDAAPYYWWCAEPPCGAFKLNDTAVDAFLDKMFDDVLPRVAPYASYWHTGGDELNANDTRLDPTVGTDNKAVLQPLLQKFTDANHARVHKAGLTPMVWEELIMDWGLRLGNDTVVQTWLGADSVKNITSAGHRVIDSNYNFWYLDCGRGQWLNFANGAATAQFYPFADWCGPSKNWRLVYSHDPADGLTAAEAKLVMGGEVAIWSETADGTNLDSLLWPRGSAAAEVLWSGNVDAAGQNRSQLTVSPRLNEFRERMVARGVMAAPEQMVWCSQADNSTECSYPVGPGY